MPRKVAQVDLVLAREGDLVEFQLARVQVFDDEGRRDVVDVLDTDDLVVSHDFHVLDFVVSQGHVHAVAAFSHSLRFFEACQVASDVLRQVCEEEVFVEGEDHVVAEDVDHLIWFADDNLIREVVVDVSVVSRVVASCGIALILLELVSRGFLGLVQVVLRRDHELAIFECGVPFIVENALRKREFEHDGRNVGPHDDNENFRLVGLLLENKFVVADAPVGAGFLKGAFVDHLASLIPDLHQEFPAPIGGNDVSVNDFEQDGAEIGLLAELRTRSQLVQHVKIDVGLDFCHEFLGGPTLHDVKLEFFVRLIDIFEARSSA